MERVVGVCVPKGGAWSPFLAVPLLRKGRRVFFSLIYNVLDQCE